MKKYLTKPSDVRVLLQDLYPILCAVNRQYELVHLVDWAKQKRVVKAQRFYEARLRDIERRILRYRISHPALVSTAYWIHFGTATVFPRPEYFPKGAASGYRFVKVKRRTKTYSMIK